MAAFGDATIKNEILDRYLRNTTALTPPATVYLALCRDHPTVTGAEVGASVGYSRQSIAFNAASGGTITGPTGTVTFGPATADWGDISWFGCYTASSGGTLLFAIPALPVTSVLNTASYSITAGLISITLD